MIPELEGPVPCASAPELFFPPDGERAGSSEQMNRVWQAQQLCKQCPITEWCRVQPRPAEFGVWGGVDEHARSKAAGVRFRHDRPIKIRVPTRCGTTAGAAKHRRLKQTVCDACREADRIDTANRRAKRASQDAA
ncbi:WhiB family transcriptional regulator [Kitasatospora cathayae]|uniref:WhiB family transcriptional regulator n=1 Tax=Kitasatospora cathayae TaxID=3004092 RepID=A0ABY7QB82_9ACTN|nr:WhiB family transcriptional regulator [Kitasatospora sp. HUAS 3-15]WBP89484.1 WhiB family transcriptional regulator [Kitasatospora sp. HUAS 3-15]